MLVTFTTDTGLLVIRAEHIRSLEDAEGGCLVEHDLNAGGSTMHRVQGTASENLARLQQEEIASMLRVQQMQQREQQGLPALPIPRGRPKGG